MTGVVFSQVTNITVSCPSAARITRKRMRGFLNAGNGCVVQYQVEVKSHSHTFESLTTELQESARTGKMDLLLQDFSTMYKTSTFQDCTMGVPTTINLRPSDAPTTAPTTIIDSHKSSSVELSTGALAGIIAGCVCFVGAIVYIIYSCQTVHNHKYRANDARVLPINDDIANIMVHA